jgi:DNA-binding CsgD family transcriptional regulator
MLLEGKTTRQIAAELGIAWTTACWYLQQICLHEGVRTRAEFLRQHGREPPPRKYEEVERRVKRGQNVAQIARELGISACAVYWHAGKLRREGRIPPQRMNARAIA